MLDATFAYRDLTMFCSLDELGLHVVGQRLEPDRAVLACRVVEPDRAVLACRVVEPDQWCRRCGCEGTAGETGTRRLAHEPLGWRPTTLVLTIRRYQCTGCGHVWRQDTGRAAEPRAKLPRRALRWALEGLVVQHLTVARIAEALAVSWNTVNDAVLTEGRRVLIDDPERFAGVKVIDTPVMTSRSTRRTWTSAPTPLARALPGTPEQAAEPRRWGRCGGDGWSERDPLQAEGVPFGVGGLGGRVAGAAGPNVPGGRRSGPDVGHGFGPRPDATGEPATCSGQRRGAAGEGSRLGSTSYSPWCCASPGVRADRIDFPVGVARLEPARLRRTYRALARRQPVDTE